MAPLEWIQKHQHGRDILTKLSENAWTDLPSIAEMTFSKTTSHTTFMTDKACICSSRVEEQSMRRSIETSAKGGLGVVGVEAS